MIRCIDSTGTELLGRRNISSTYSISQSDVEDSSRLADIISRLSARVTNLEASKQPDAVEFIVDFDGDTHYLHHGFNGPVRWWIVYNTGLTDFLDTVLPGDPPAFDVANVLALQCASSGRVVVRIEPSQFGA